MRTPRASPSPSAGWLVRGRVGIRGRGKGSGRVGVGVGLRGGLHRRRVQASGLHRAAPPLYLPIPPPVSPYISPVSAQAGGIHRSAAQGGLRPQRRRAHERRLRPKRPGRGRLPRARAHQLLRVPAERAARGGRLRTQVEPAPDLEPKPKPKPNPNPNPSPNPSPNPTPTPRAACWRRA